MQALHVLRLEGWSLDEGPAGLVAKRRLDVVIPQPLAHTLLVVSDSGVVSVHC